MFDYTGPPQLPFRRGTKAKRHKAIFTAIAGYLTTALIGIGINAAIAGVAANLVIGAVLLGASYLLTPRPPVMSTPQAQAVLNQSIAPRIRGYGYALLGGTRAFYDSSGGTLYQVVMMHSGEIDGIEYYKIGDIIASLAGNGVAVNDVFTTKAAPGGGAQPVGGPGGAATTYYHITIRGHLGSPDQTVDALMDGAWEMWTSAHRLRGIAYFVASFTSPGQESFQKVFPEAHNTPVRALCRLSRVWDPRNDTTAFSENASLAILDYLTHPDGFRKTRANCDLDSFAAFANLCDENVALAGGGTEKRYRLSGVYSLNDEPEDILRKMRATCDAELYQNAAGKIAIRGGKWEAPTVTITERDILGHTMEQGNNKFAAFNELKITYTSPAHDYQTMEATTWADLADQDERGPIPSNLDLDFVPSPSQARRLAKIHVSKANPRWKGRIKTNLMGLDALGERTIRVVLPELEIDEAFYVAGFSIAPDLTSVEIEVMSISEAAYAWDPATEEGQNPAAPQNTTPDLTFPVPQNLTLTNPAPGRIDALVDPIDRTDLFLQVQIRAGAGAIWQEMTIGEIYNSGVATGLAEGVYVARARWVGAQNAASDWSFPYPEIDTETAVPSPIDLMADVDGADVEISWRNPNYPTFSRARVWRSAGADPFSSAVEINMQYGSPNSVYYFMDTPSVGTWRYWVTAVGATGATSTPAGPVSVTVV